MSQKDVGIVLPTLHTSACMSRLPSFTPDSASVATDAPWFFAQVLADASSAQRSGTTGHLVLTCPKMHPLVTSRAPERRKPERAMLKEPAAALSTPAERLKGTVDIRSIVPSGPAAQGAAAAQEPSLGAEWDDEDDVPPLL
eukprot:6193091-Pleurochrysis_carterae.AAC.5